MRPIVFETLASALRISTKYEIQFLRDWAIAQMHTTWPSNLDQMVPMALPHAAGSFFSLSQSCFSVTGRCSPSISMHRFLRLALPCILVSYLRFISVETENSFPSLHFIAFITEAISLARECKVPEVLPAAFYALSIQKWRSKADGERAHNVLSRKDLRRLVMGREALQDLLVEIVAAPLSVPAPPPPPPGTSGSSKGIASADAYADIGKEKPQSMMPPPPPAHPAFAFCPPPAPCRARLELLWRTRLSPDFTRPWNTWLLRELHRMATLPLSSLDENLTENGYPASSTPSTTTSAAEMVDENGAIIPPPPPPPEPLVCVRCWGENRRLAVWRLDCLRVAIPKWFDL